MTRQEKINKGKLWQVCHNEAVLFEGSKTAAIQFMRSFRIYGLWKKGLCGYSLGKLIWEDLTKK